MGDKLDRDGNLLRKIAFALDIFVREFRRLARHGFRELHAGGLYFSRRDQLQHIVRAVEAKKDGSVPEDFFHDMLDEQFSEEETLRQLETAISWGRYAELFDFDASRRRFTKPERLNQELGESEEALAESEE